MFTTKKDRSRQSPSSSANFWGPGPQTNQPAAAGSGPSGRTSFGPPAAARPSPRPQGHRQASPWPGPNCGPNSAAPASPNLGAPGPAPAAPWGNGPNVPNRPTTAFGPSRNTSTPASDALPNPWLGSLQLPAVTLGPAAPRATPPLWPTPAAPATSPTHGGLLIPLADTAAQQANAAQLLHYALTNGSRGWVLRDSLDRAPTSQLAQQLRGTVAVPKDEQGRPIIACHPTRWAQVQEYLATGTAPEAPSVELLAQAQAFGLSGLVEQLEAALPGVVSFDRHQGGFTAKFAFTEVVSTPDQGSATYSVLSDNGLHWTLGVGTEHVVLHLQPLEAPPSNAANFDCTVQLRAHLRDNVDEVGGQRLMYRGTDCVLGWNLTDFSYSLDELLSHRTALRRNSLVLSIRVSDIRRFESPGVASAQELANSTLRF